MSFGAGLRWTPFEPAPQPTSVFGSAFPAAYGDLRAFYVTGVVGANLRDRLTRTMADPIEDTAWSPMASVAIGLEEAQGRDWTFGPEFREQLAYYDGTLQRGWMLLVAVHLRAW